MNTNEQNVTPEQAELYEAIGRMEKDASGKYDDSEVRQLIGSDAAAAQGGTHPTTVPVSLAVCPTMVCTGECNH